MTEPDRFLELLTKLARVPKREIDDQEAKYQQERKPHPKRPKTSRRRAARRHA